MHPLLQSITKDLDQWVTVPKPGVTKKDALFSGMEDMLMNVCETRISQLCLLLKMAQQYAYLFTLMQFQVTGMNDRLFLQYWEGSRKEMGLAPIPVKKATVGH